ncbi:hypothetical protein BN871_CN_00010 [Paenibacillus sp. P22]|nr:hypothetical protein BN871_CN_00010 [Paenibacillus sp. P22]
MNVAARRERAGRGFHQLKSAGCGAEQTARIDVAAALCLDCRRLRIPLGPRKHRADMARDASGMDGSARMDVDCSRRRQRHRHLRQRPVDQARQTSGVYLRRIRSRHRDGAAGRRLAGEQDRSAEAAGEAAGMNDASRRNLDGSGIRDDRILVVHRQNSGRIAGKAACIDDSATAGRDRSFVMRRLHLQAAGRYVSDQPASVGRAFGRDRGIVGHIRHLALGRADDAARICGAREAFGPDADFVLDVVDDAVARHPADRRAGIHVAGHGGEADVAVRLEAEAADRASLHVADQPLVRDGGWDAHAGDAELRSILGDERAFERVALGADRHPIVCGQIQAVVHFQNFALEAVDAVILVDELGDSRQLGRRVDLECGIRRIEPARIRRARPGLGAGPDHHGRAAKRAREQNRSERGRFPGRFSFCCLHVLPPAYFPVLSRQPASRLEHDAGLPSAAADYDFIQSFTRTAIAAAWLRVSGSFGEMLPSMP